MSGTIADLTVQGYLDQLRDTKGMLAASTGAPQVAFPDTNYNLPLYFGLTGSKVRTVAEAAAVIAGIESRNRGADAATLDLPAIAGLGQDVLLLQEVYKALESSTGHTVGFIPDNVLRSLGVQLVSGDIVGIAVIIGPARDAAEAVTLVRSLQEKSILTVLCGSHEGRTMKEQLEASSVEMSLETHIVWLGADTESTVLALNWAIRAALTFGGLEGGQKQECLQYCAKRVPAFALALTGLDAKKVATAAGAISMGFPVIAGLDVPEIPGHLVSCPDVSRIVERALEVRNIKVKVSALPIPVRFGSAFEGERVRKEELGVELGGQGRTALELVVMDAADRIENHRITVSGREIDTAADGERLDLAIVVKVAGRGMQKDFEPILERQIHHFLNCAMGVMHTGQRDLVRIRIARSARQAGFTFRHLGEILYGKLMGDYGMIVDRLEVTIFTEPASVKVWAHTARDIYRERDLRIGTMTDESVEEFYSCTLCQSFAPNHVCIITPERLGLCGAYNWLDGKAAHRIMPTGPNQPVPKGAVLDKVLGQWAGVNDFIVKASNQTLERFSAYSLMVDPMTSCGCFECIVTILPGTGGYMLVDRGFSGMTPCGMTFSTLAGVVGGGKQSPGFLGIGANYIASRKFLSAEGGLERLVWMPSGLKERLGEALTQRAAEAGFPDLLDRICDERAATDMSGLLAFLEARKHPALAMGELI